MSDRSHILGVM